MVPDRSIDFMFSFDSLVHVESEIIQTYLAQLSKKLKTNGVGFIHHSNIGEYPRKRFLPNEKLPWKIRNFLTSVKDYDKFHFRAFSMTAERFENHCRNTGLQCISQEIVNWGSKSLIDCMSIFTPSGSTWSRSIASCAMPTSWSKRN